MVPRSFAPADAGFFCFRRNFMQGYIISIERYLKEFGVILDYSTNKQRWSHAKLIEVLNNRGMGSLICGTKSYLQNEEDQADRDMSCGLDLESQIRRGQILQVEDYKHKIRHYRNPYYQRSIDDTQLFAMNQEMLENVLYYLKITHANQLRQIFEQGGSFDSNELYVNEYIIDTIEQHLQSLQEEMQGYKAPQAKIRKRRR